MKIEIGDLAIEHYSGGDVYSLVTEVSDYGTIGYYCFHDESPFGWIGVILECPLDYIESAPPKVFSIFRSGIKIK